jgi:hypothetical protein
MMKNILKTSILWLAIGLAIVAIIFLLAYFNILTPDTLYNDVPSASAHGA